MYKSMPFFAFLPPYAPDMNPIKYLWTWLKRHALVNYCPDTLGELQAAARNKRKNAQKRAETRLDHRRLLETSYAVAMS